MRSAFAAGAVSASASAETINTTQAAERRATEPSSTDPRKPPTHRPRSGWKRVPRLGYLDPSFQGIWPRGNADLGLMTTAAATYDPEVDQHIGVVREDETSGMRGRTLWSSLLFATGFLALAPVLPFPLESPPTPSPLTVVAL